MPRLYPDGYAAHPAVPVCIFGPTGHGKSVYIDALLHHLETRTRGWPRFSAQWMSQENTLAIRTRLRLLREHGSLPEATPAVFPRPQVLRLRNVPRVGGCQLLFFDNSGETFNDVTLFTDAGRYIRHARAVVWLVSLTDLEYPQQLSDLMTVYAEAMRKLGGDPKEQTVILALTKGDRFRATDGLPASAREFLENDDLDPAGDAWSRLDRLSTDLQQWLRQGKHANVVNLLPELFKATRFCIVSALGAETDAETNQLALDIMPRGVLAPLFWLWRETLPSVVIEFGGRRALHFSLATALEAAPEGATLHLGPHTYVLPNRVEVRRALQVVGRGAAVTTVVCADRRFVLGIGPKRGEVHLSDLAMRHEGAAPADVIRVVRGSAVLVRCSVSGGVQAAPTIPGDGVLSVKDATAELRECQSLGNQGHGLSAREQAKVVARQCRLTGNGGSGLYAVAVSAKAHHCVMRDNRENGAHVTGATRALLTHNECSSNAKSGITVGADALVELRNNLCDNNGRHGIACKNRAVVAADLNGCTDNKGCGIVADDRVTGQINGSVCSGNGANGIELGGQASPTVSRNNCRENKAAGIAYTGTAAGTCEANSCDENRDGIEVADSAAPELCANTATGNNRYGFTASSHAARWVGTQNVTHGNRKANTNPPKLLRRSWFRSLFG